MEVFVYVLYTLAILALVSFMVRSAWRTLTGNNPKPLEETYPPRLGQLRLETIRLLKYESYDRMADLEHTTISEVAAMTTRAAGEDVAAIALDISFGILEATRSSERRLAKAQGEELLKALRDELAIAPADIPTDQLVHSIRAKLIRLTEMMVEAQVSLVEVNHKVVDMDSLVRQLPRVLDSHRENILSLAHNVEEMSQKYASKTELKLVEKEVEILRWVFSSALAVVLALLGWMITRR